MRTLFITDIHGYYYPMMKLLKHANYVPGKDILVVGGDMIDRGPDSGKVLKELRILQNNNPSSVHILKGNHETMMEECLLRGERRWLFYGGSKAMDSFDVEFIGEELTDYVKWVRDLPLVYEHDKFVFTHAGLDPKVPLGKQRHDINECSYEDFYSLDKEILLSATNGRPIVHGHVATEYIISDGARMNCDLGMAVMPKEDAQLALVDLSNFTYIAYKQDTNKISGHSILAL